MRHPSSAGENSDTTQGLDLDERRRRRKAVIRMSSILRGGFEIWVVALARRSETRRGHTFAWLGVFDARGAD